ncbi:nitrite reductase small subunit NirD [Chondrinema litorale]|uniref:nitrite reductase small subunit NirD n=1 Tax=Chondrinema litorale TaxID=2994555 RepID=UPI0025438723|nr:nitrite reductase small subunit NirD [Chondrinema litorale]UZR99517.1 nitrite reductase small subunit NirD [Chondrinema litorale]
MQDILDRYKSVSESKVAVWFKVGSINDFPENGGGCIKYKSKQIAVYNFSRKGKWYACQNLCPHKMEMVLSRGMIGDESGLAKVACPMHKKTFSLDTGQSLSDEDLKIAVYPVKVQDENVYIGFSE